MMKYASVTLALVLGVALAGSTANAQLLDSSGSASIDLNGSAGTGDTQLGISTDATTTVEADPAAGTSAEENDASALEFRFDHKSLTDDMSYSVTESGSVRTSASLESYAATSVRDNDRVESIELGNGELQMRYKQDAKFLWVIPATMATDITVDANGTVTASYPWYSFLLSTDENEDELAARLESRIDSLVADDASADGVALEVSADSSTQIRYWARAMDRIMKSLSSDAAVTASGEVQTQ